MINIIFKDRFTINNTLLIEYYTQLNNIIVHIKYIYNNTDVIPPFKLTPSHRDMITELIINLRFIDNYSNEISSMNEFINNMVLSSYYKGVVTNIQLLQIDNESYINISNNSNSMYIRLDSDDTILFINSLFEIWEDQI